MMGGRVELHVWQLGINEEGSKWVPCEAVSGVRSSSDLVGRGPVPLHRMLIRVEEVAGESRQDYWVS
jgi:hypothetical protein